MVSRNPRSSQFAKLARGLLWDGIWPVPAALTNRWMTVIQGSWRTVVLTASSLSPPPMSAGIWLVNWPYAVAEGHGADLLRCVQPTLGDHMDHAYHDCEHSLLGRT